MNLYFKHLCFTYDFPATNEPSWKSHVDRWYQLDAYAYGLVQAYTQWKEELPERPSAILLASPAASNETDRQFAQAGGLSPSKFVHTLPNIRCSPLCQVMDWTGPVFSLHRDPHTLVLALREGFDLISPEWPSVWVLSVFRDQDRYQVHGFFLTSRVELCRVSKRTSGPPSAGMRTLPEDRGFLEWLNRSDKTDPSFELPGDYEVICEV